MPRIDLTFVGESKAFTKLFSTVSCTQDQFSSFKVDIIRQHIGYISALLISSAFFAYYINDVMLNKCCNSIF